MPTQPWDILLAAWMHDPPDKAAELRGHLARAVQYAKLVFRRRVSEAELRLLADELASAYERLPMPKAQDCLVAPDNGVLWIVHPLSAQEKAI